MSNVQRFKALVQREKAREQMSRKERTRRHWRPTSTPLAEMVTFDDWAEWKQRNGVQAVTVTLSPTGEVCAEVVCDG